MAIQHPPPMPNQQPPLSQVLRELLEERGLSVIGAARLLGRRTRNMNKESWEGTLRKILNGKQLTVNKTTQRALARVFEVPEATFARRRLGPVAAMRQRLAETEERAAALEAERDRLLAELRRRQGDGSPDPE